MRLRPSKNNFLKLSGKRRTAALNVTHLHSSSSSPSSATLESGLKIIRRNVLMFNSIPDDGGRKTKNWGTISGPHFTVRHYVILFFISILNNLLHTYTRRHTRLSSTAVIRVQIQCCGWAARRHIPRLRETFPAVSECTHCCKRRKENKRKQKQKQKKHRVSDCDD